MKTLRRPRAKHRNTMPIVLILTLVGVLVLYSLQFRENRTAFNQTFGRAFTLTPTFLTVTRDIHLLRKAHLVEEQVDRLAGKLAPLADSTTLSSPQSGPIDSSVYYPPILCSTETPQKVQHLATRCPEPDYDSVYVSWNGQYHLPSLWRHNNWSIGSHNPYKPIADSLVATCFSWVSESMTCETLKELRSMRPRTSSQLPPRLIAPG